MAAAEPTPLPDHSPDHSPDHCIPTSDPPCPDGGQDDVLKKPVAVWNKPSVPTSHVIADEDSWPALSESIRVSSKSSLHPPPVSTSQAHSISIPKKNQNRNQNHAKTNQNHKSNTNNQTTTQSRQKSRRGGANSSGGFSQNGINHHPRPVPRPQPPPPPPPMAPLPPPLPPYPIYEVPFGPLPPPMPIFVPPSFNGQSFQRNPNPRANNGPRRDHHHDRNGPHKGFGRPQAPPPPPLPFSPMSSTRPFPESSGFNMAPPYLPPPEFFMRFPPPPPPPLFPRPMDPSLPIRLIKQIDHYFSDDNLAKDSFLRARMDDEGWVDIAFIAAFPMVRQMTQNLQLILDSLKGSTVVEIQGNLIRRRNDWKKWIISVPRSTRDSSSPSPSGLAETMLTSSIKNVILEDETDSINVVPFDGKADSCSDVGHSNAAK